MEEQTVCRKIALLGTELFLSVCFHKRKEKEEHARLS